MTNPLTLENLDRLAKLKCVTCSAEVRIATIKEQMAGGFEWQVMPSSGAVICGYCWEEIKVK